MKTWKKILWGLLLLALTSGGYGWYLYHKKPADVRQLSVDKELSAADLMQAFQLDETAATQQYVDKILIVSGKVSNLQVDTSGQATITLDTGDPLSAVVCSFYKEEVGKVQKIAPGHPVRIKGLCTGMLMDVVLNKCSMAQ